MPKLSIRTFLHSFLKLVPSGLKFAYFYICGKPLVLKSASFMPSGTILKVFKKNPVYILAMI